MHVNKRKIGADYAPYIIAELSANHGGSIERAKASILKASAAGVSAVKIQSYSPDTMTIKCDKPDFMIKDGLWAGSDLYDLYKSAFTPFEWHEELFAYAKQIGVTLFSTPFDESAVDLLEKLDTPAYKIASFEITDLPLIEYIAKKQKPIFLSTGMASISEITEAVATIRNYSNGDILLFHCISSYPAPTEQANLNNIIFLKKEFQLEVGLSDHSISNMAASMAIAMGAVAIEKHFKLNDDEKGPDTSFSLNIKQLENLVHDCNIAWQAKGAKAFGRAENEKNNTIFRRSIYFVKDLKAGQTISDQDVRRIRPGNGLEPKHFSAIIGKKINQDVERGDPVSWDLLS